MSDDITSAVNHTSGKPGRRLKILRISSDILVALLSNDGSRLHRIDGMPADARIVGMSDHLYFEQDQWALQVESAEFPDVKYGAHIPPLDLTCHSLYPEAGMTLADLRAFARTETLRDTGDMTIPPDTPEFRRWLETGEREPRGLEAKAE